MSLASTWESHPVNGCLGYLSIYTTLLHLCWASKSKYHAVIAIALHAFCLWLLLSESRLACKAVIARVASYSIQGPISKEFIISHSFHNYITHTNHLINHYYPCGNEFTEPVLFYWLVGEHSVFDSNQCCWKVPEAIVVSSDYSSLQPHGTCHLWNSPSVNNLKSRCCSVQGYPEGSTAVSYIMPSCRDRKQSWIALATYEMSRRRTLAKLIVLTREKPQDCRCSI